MQTRFTVTPELTAELFDKTILLRRDSPAPRGGTYGWLTEGAELTLFNDVVIEQNVGLYGGAYMPMIGGRRASGLASVGAFTYSYSGLPDGASVGRYCSISGGLRFIDSSHPLELLTTSALTFRPANHLFREFVTDAITEHAAGYSTTPDKPYPRIGNDVWIGSNVTLAMGIEVGTGAVVATNSTVTKDVPPYAIVGGNPGGTGHTSDRLGRSHRLNGAGLGRPLDRSYDHARRSFPLARNGLHGTAGRHRMRATISRPGSVCSGHLARVSLQSAAVRGEGAGSRQVAALHTKAAGRAISYPAFCCAGPCPKRGGLGSALLDVGDRVRVHFRAFLDFFSARFSLMVFTGFLASSGAAFCQACGRSLTAGGRDGPVILSYASGTATSAMPTKRLPTPSYSLRTSPAATPGTSYGAWCAQQT